MSRAGPGDGPAAAGRGPGRPVAGVEEAVAAARCLVDALVSAGPGTELDMAQVAARIDAVAREVADRAPSLDDRLARMWSGPRVRHDPVAGPENALAPPLVLTALGDGSVEGRATLGLAYQGPPRCVHGGVSALLLDHALGFANHETGISGMTGRLTLRYHRPAPLFEELRIRARQVSVEGRKIRTTGELLVGDKVCVSADGLFIRGPLPTSARDE